MIQLTIWSIFGWDKISSSSSFGKDKILLVWEKEYPFTNNLIRLKFKNTNSLQSVKDAIIEYDGIYLGAIGGAGAMMSSCIKTIATITTLPTLKRLLCPLLYEL